MDESSLDDADKTQISDLLNEDFSKHSDCVALVTKQVTSTQFFWFKCIDSQANEMTTSYFVGRGHDDDQGELR